jgi:hypothetical protein
MNEENWQNENRHSQGMLWTLQDTAKVTRTKVGKRKLRLFACGCCRLMWEWLTEPRLRHAVLIAERFAEGDAEKEDLEAAARVRELGLSHGRLTANAPGWEQRCAALLAQATTAPRAFSAAFDVTATALPLPDNGAGEPGRQALRCDLLRCVFGNPFRPLAARKLPPHVVGLASDCYTAFPAVSERFALLADALADLGEDEAAAHCRTGAHIKGCHVVDWATGRG